MAHEEEVCAFVAIAPVAAAPMPVWWRAARLSEAHADMSFAPANVAFGGKADIMFEDQNFAYHPRRTFCLRKRRLSGAVESSREPLITSGPTGIC